MTVGTCGSSIVSKSQIETMSMAQVEDQKKFKQTYFKSESESEPKQEDKRESIPTARLMNKETFIS